MSVVTYDAGQMLLRIDDTGVERALGDLRSKAPAVLKVAINRTARQARHDLIDEAERRYALTARGKARLRLLKLRKSATNRDLTAEIRQSDQGFTLNASYFRHTPTAPRMGIAALSGPAFQRVQTLTGGPMEDLTAGTGLEKFKKEKGKPRKAPVLRGYSKGFLIRVTNIKNEHLMYTQRMLGSESGNDTTYTGKPRWKNAVGKVEKAYGVERIGSSSQQRAVWDRGVDNTAAENLERFVEQRISQVIEAAK